MTSGTIRVEIDDFTELHDVDELKKPIKIGEMEWTLGAYSETSARTAHVRHLGVVLHCNKSIKSNLWSVSASIRFKLCKSGQTDVGQTSETCHVDFSSCQKTFEIPNFMNWQEVTSPENGYLSDNTAVLEAFIHVDSIQGFHVAPQKSEFDAPKEHLTDAILVVGGKKCHVAKQILAMSSRKFHEIFFGSGEKNLDDVEEKVPEVVIDDVAYSEFSEFLNLIYRNSDDINDKNVEFLLKLAAPDRFATSRILEKCENFLISTSQMHIVDKLKLAEIHKFSLLQNHCLSLLKTTEEVLELAKHERHKSLSAVTSEVLFQRIAEISSEVQAKASSEVVKESEVVEEESPILYESDA